MANLDGTDELFDSREVIERIEELEGIEVIDRTPEDQDELDALLAFAEEGGSLSDWDHGETFIRDDYFPDYAEEFVKDVGYIPGDLPGWIEDAIDWDKVADSLKVDYTDFEFMGETYWARSY